MIPCFIIVSIAFYWLLRETSYLRVRLEQYEGLEDYDRRILGQLEAEYKAKQEQQYQEWLERRYAPRLRYGKPDADQYDIMSPADKALAKEEILYNKRWGLNPFQPLGYKGYCQLTKKEKELLGI